MDLLKMPFKAKLKLLNHKAKKRKKQMLNNQIDRSSQKNSLDVRIEKIWKESENTRKFNQLDVTGDWDIVKSRICEAMPAGPRKIPLTMQVLRIAAILIIASGIAFVFYKVLTMQRTETVTVYTYKADRSIQDVRMPDGSVVSLNIGSSLSYRDDFNNATRDVNLEGEGLFDVVSGQALPFRVYAGESVVEVTGTTFSIYEKDGIVKVAVIDGSVKLGPVDNTNRQINISKNQCGYLLANNELKVKDGIDVNNLSWKTGLLVFDETPLDSALIDIAHHFRKELSIKTDIGVKVTAEFENQPLSEILDELEQVARLVFDTTGGSLIVRR